MGHSKLVPRGLSSSKCKMAVFHRYLYNLETYDRMESIQKSFVEAYCYPKEFRSDGGGK